MADDSSSSPPAAEQADAWTVGRLLTWTTDWLAGRGSDSPRLDAEVLLAAVRGCPRILLYTAFDEPVGEDQRSRFRDLVRRRGGGEPVAYLVGSREFFSLSFEVNPATLIPRPETEGLVIRLLDLWKQRGAATGPRLVDVGTGSGAIGITLATRLPGASVLATDRSAAAVAVAGRNAERHRVADRLELLVADLLDHPTAAGPWDFIISNPPYVREDEFDSLPPDVRLHEPREALVAGPTGCELIARLLPQAARRLAPGGWLLVEVGPATAAEAERLVAGTAGLVAEPTLPDAAGLPRILQARKPE